MKTFQFCFLFLVKITKRYGRSNLKYLAVFLLLLFAGWVLARVGFLHLRSAALSEGLVGIYEVHSLPPTVTNLLSEALVVPDKFGKPQPNLVSGWQVNNDATQYTFKLKENLTWNDGVKVRSSDIRFNLTDVEVTYPDDQTLVFKLVDSFTPFPTLLTTPVLRKNSLVGLGKYKIVYLGKSHNIVAKLVLAPKNDETLPLLTIRFYPDEKTARTAFDLGEVESLVGVSTYEDLSKYPLVRTKKTANFNKLTAVFYNTKDAVLSDKNLRKALSFATPELEVGENAVTSIPSFSWAFNSQVREAGGDLVTAKNYLAKVQSGKDKPLVLTTVPDLASQGEKIVEGWRTLGLTAQLKVESGNPQNFQALLISQPIPSDPDQYALWHSTQGITNISKYSSPRIDKDLEDGRKTADWEKRKEKYLDFQKVLLDDSPATFLYFPPTQVLYRQKIEENLNKVISLQIPQV